jgi:F-type H+-transporting ATPase subunit b
LPCSWCSFASNSQTAGSSEQPTPQAQPENPNSAIGGDLASESREAAGEENAQFKYSASVRWFARHLGMNEHQMYWVSLVVNFGLLGLFFYYLFRSKLPQAFRDRTATIQKSIKEAQAASAEASRRLSDIEARLSKLDAEVGEIRASAEREAAAEEERIRQAAEEDKRKVVQAAESEIDAIARNARRELKGYAASLAVDLAARQIQVDDSTDHALVREFVDQMGKDGK